MTKRKENSSDGEEASLKQSAEEEKLAKKAKAMSIHESIARHCVSLGGKILPPDDPIYKSGPRIYFVNQSRRPKRTTSAGPANPDTAATTDSNDSEFTESLGPAPPSSPDLDDRQ